MTPTRILDNLPIGIVRIRSNQGKQIKAYERGFPVGFKEVGIVGLRVGAGRRRALRAGQACQMCGQRAPARPCWPSQPDGAAHA